MRQFETKLTLRIYDTKLIEKMNMIMKFNPNRYQSKNQLLLELLELGVREKLKEFPTPPTTPVAAANAIPISHECNCNAETLKQIKELIEGMHLYNKQNVEGLLAHLKMSERLSSSIYNMVFCHSERRTGHTRTDRTRLFGRCAKTICGIPCYVAR